MAEFRKLFLVLAAIAALSVTGYAQTFICVGNPGANKALRGGGITELLGDVLLTCSDTDLTNLGTVTGSFTVQISNGANTITNRIGGIDANLNAYPTQAAAEVRSQFKADGPLQVVQGYLSADNPSLMLFPNVILPTGTTGIHVRFTNIRVKADPVALNAAPVQVNATVGTAGGDLPFTNSVQNPGIIYPSLQFSVTDCAGGTAPSLAYQQCISEPRTNDGALSFGIRFQELNSTSAFRNKVNGAPAPGYAYEDGNNGLPITGPADYTMAPNYAPGTEVTLQDVADTATRLVARFTNVPAGVSLYVTTREVATMSTGVQGTHLAPAAELLKGTDGTDALGSAASAVTLDTADGVTCSKTEGALVDNDDDPIGLAKISTDGNGNYIAVFRVTRNDANIYEHLGFGVQVRYDANPSKNTPAISATAGTIAGLFAPISDVLVAADIDTAPIPRFIDNPISSASPFSIGPCVTNLLFPYVTTRDGYNTGIALVNTSKDNVSTGTAAAVPFDTSSQTGTCTMYFFGDQAPTGGWVPKTTTPATGIVPGTLYKAVVSDLAPNFEGYVIARCNFQYAHGLAFILTSSGSGSQYLALVIPDRGGSTTRLPDPFTVPGPGSGEQLGY